MTCVRKCRFDLEVCGGIFVDERFVIDRNLISATAWKDHGLYMKQWMALVIDEQARMDSAGESAAAD